MAATTMTTTSISTEFGHSLPPQGAHTITIHAPGWDVLQKFVDGDEQVMAKIKSMYPRFGPFNEAKMLIGTVISKLPEGHMPLLFPNKDSATACIAYITSPSRKDEERVDAKDVSVKAFAFGPYRVFAAVFPAAKVGIAVPFWQDPGTGVCTRFAEDCLAHAADFKEVSIDEPLPKVEANPVYQTLKERIAKLIDTNPLESATHTKNISPDDVYLFQTGMAAIYLPHIYLSASRPGTTILYGFAFHSTPHIFEKFGANTSHFKWFHKGGDTDISALEAFLEAEHAASRPIQALWAEFPTNPNLTTPPLNELRRLATKFDTPLIIDDTVAGFANVDLFGTNGADATISSLTKSFSGYANVMAGAFSLNPSTKHYAALKEVLEKHYVNDLYVRDAETLESNSRDFLSRTAILNRNAASLATHFSNPEYADLISAIHYPSLAPTKKNYDAYLRAPTSELPNPGYGCLLSFEFTSLDATRAFYDNVALHCGPHLGAHRTIILPYNYLMALQAKRENVTGPEAGTTPSWIRFSVGLEDEQELVQAVEAGLLKAREVLKAEGVSSQQGAEEAEKIAKSTLT